jgi:hypothetical protein
MCVPMKTLTTLLLCFMALIVHAQIHVSSGQNLQTAINNAPVGSTLIVDGGFNYGNIDIAKKLTLIGPGYFLSPGTQASTGAAVLGTVSFKTGSSNSVMMGFVTGSAYLGTDNLMFMRNYVGINLRLGYDGVSNCPSNVSNLTAKQNFVVGEIYIGNCVNFLIKSNIVNSGLDIDCLINTAVKSGTIINNTFCATSANSAFFDYYSAISSNVNFKNNILIYGGSSGTGIFSSGSGVYATYNVFAGTSGNIPVPTPNTTNKTVVDFNSLYVGYPNNPNTLNPDARNQLSTSSPAKGTGEGGTDCGAFGGNEPYILSGLPSGPIVYELVVPTQVQTPSTLNIQVKARVQN